MMFLRKKFIYPDMPDSAHSLMNQKGLQFGENSICFSFSPFLLFFCVFAVTPSSALYFALVLAKTRVLNNNSFIIGVHHNRDN